MKLTLEQRAEIVRRYAAGELRKALARAFNITEAYVSILARRAGWPLRDPHRKLTHEQRAKVEELIRMGVKKEAIACEFGISRSRVKDISDRCC
jgi:DNA invertase Pin-like site-specific DNA recombinase